MTQQEMSTTEKAKNWWNKHKPGEKPELIDATYELRDLGPYDNDTQGAPIPRWFLAAFILWSIVFGWWFWQFFIADPRLLSPELFHLGYWGGIAIDIIFALVAGFVGIYLYQGISGAYKWHLHLRIWDMNETKEPVREELRVKNKSQIWNPITKQGAWRSPETHKEILEMEEKHQEKKEIQEEIEELKRMREEARKQAEIDKIAEMEDSRTENKMKEAGKRFTSAQELIKAARIMSKSVSPAKERDEIKEVMELRKRFIQVIEAIDLPYYVTVLNCEGNKYPLVLSDRPLFGGDEREGRSEFSIHSKTVRTWVPWTQQRVNNVCLGSAVKLTDYRHLMLPNDKLATSEEKQEKIKYAPILYITHSDGFVDKVKDNYRHNKNIPNQNDAIQTELVYSSTVADDLFEKHKLVTSEVDKTKKSEKEMERDFEARFEDTLATALKYVQLAETAGQQGIVGRIRGTSWGTALKWIAYMFGMAMVVIGFLALLNSMGYIHIDWLTPGNETSDEWTVGSLMLSWLKLGIRGIP